MLDSDAQRRRGSTFLPGESSISDSLLPSPKPFERPGRLTKKKNTPNLEGCCSFIQVSMYVNLHFFTVSINRTVVFEKKG